MLAHTPHRSTYTMLNPVVIINKLLYSRLDRRVMRLLLTNLGVLIMTA